MLGVHIFDGGETIMQAVVSSSVSIKTGNEMHSNVTPQGMIQWRRMRVSSIFYVVIRSVARYQCTTKYMGQV